MSGHYVSRVAIFNTVPEAANSQWIVVKSKEKGRYTFLLWLDGRGSWYQISILYIRSSVYFKDHIIITDIMFMQNCAFG